MYYVCIENDKVIGVQNYEPSVPPSVEVVSVTDEQYRQMLDRTHVFDIPSKTVVSASPEQISNREQEQKNAVEREFLNSTDWKVMRHIREKALGIATSLTEEEYLALEQLRDAAASRIIKVQ